MKYTVGDKVRVKSLDWYNANKNLFGNVTSDNQSFTKNMTRLCGKLITIEKCDKETNSYKICGDPFKYYWKDWMFEEIMNNEVKIEVPEGYIIDEENSTYECIKFKKKEPKVEISAVGECVLVKHPEYKFIIFDIEDLRTDFDSAFKLAKIYDCEATIPTREQWKIIHEHLDEINGLLRNEIEKDYYWTSKEEDSFYSWITNMNGGTSFYSRRIHAYRVRAIKNYRLS